MGNLLFCYDKENNKDNIQLLGTNCYDKKNNKDNLQLFDKDVNIDVDYDSENDVTYIRINLDYLDHLHQDVQLVDSPIQDY
jgi:hypothetical protein